MPANFNLYLLSDPEKIPVKLTIVDEMICRHFGKEIDPLKYYFDWFDTIGLRLAIGKDFDMQVSDRQKEIEEDFKDKPDWIECNKHEIEIIKYMRSVFGFNSWTSRSK
jgi:hypothetical protein